MFAVPLITPGGAGALFTVIASEAAALVPQPLEAVTEMLPLEALAVVLIELVVEVPVHPPGSVQTYEVAPDTAVIEYVLEVPEQMVTVPLIAPGVAGIEFTVMASDEAALVPHPFVADTVMLPLVVLAVVLMLLVVDVPVHPPGNVQV